MKTASWWWTKINVPAARLLKDYGVSEFYLFLKKAGLKNLFRSSGDYGLTLILGGAETSLYELARLYRGLGRYGIFGPLKLFKDQKEVYEEDSGYLIDPGACYLTLNVLREVSRPGAIYLFDNFAFSNRVKSLSRHFDGRHGVLPSM